MLFVLSKNGSQDSGAETNCDDDEAGLGVQDGEGRTGSKKELALLDKMMSDVPLKDAKPLRPLRLCNLTLSTPRKLVLSSSRPKHRYTVGLHFLLILKHGYQVRAIIQSSLTSSGEGLTDCKCYDIQLKR